MTLEEIKEGIENGDITYIDSLLRHIPDSDIEDYAESDLGMVEKPEETTLKDFYMEDIIAFAIGGSDNMEHLAQLDKLCDTHGYYTVRDKFEDFIRSFD